MRAGDCDEVLEDVPMLSTLTLEAARTANAGETVDEETVAQGLVCDWRDGALRWAAHTPTAARAIRSHEESKLAPKATNGL